ncbi:putative disease resistance protein RGA3 isoform X3 [Asparagus officinalis]|nr:putative disease resistance protein RGA3 isoform X3 [Asparagus officinalis]XP_020269340.1 putative disease resistance protein RGA3 isoform X3 [Asparagus officinalis]
MLQESNQLQQQHQTQSKGSNRETGPILTEKKVFGRIKEREELLQWLMKPVAEEDESVTSVSLFSITGHGGVGKTTLAQLVYNDESLANSFSRKIWVCISTPFDVKKVLADMIEYATRRKPKIVGLGTLQEALKEIVSSGKFLLVLDDAWNHDNRSEWDKLFAPLRSGHKGSKILLTTRTVRVAEMAALALGGSMKESMKLKPLDDDNFLSLFNQYAFAGVNLCDYSKLESIGEKIAKRLGGLPLAAKTIGALLNSNLDGHHWTRILQSNNISDEAQQGDGVMSVLMLSYYHLPIHLRPCFAYCSIFPKDYDFVKDDLVFMWMALGFIQKSPQNATEALEDIGRRYFDDLVKLSFLEPNYDIVYFEEEERKYIMHDLLHDLAGKVSHDECFTFVGDMSIDQIPNTVRHLYFETDKLDLLQDVDKWRNLRTLVLIFRGYVIEHANSFEEVFKSLESIRVLNLTVDGMKVLPDATGNLRHLRYLSIHHGISRLPSSFCKLYHLQVLASKYFGTHSILDLNNLISLRQLIPCSEYYEKIGRIGTLTSLQRLCFPASAYKISELKDLRELQELKINGLENVNHCEEASMVDLHVKNNLHKLHLVWSDDADVADEYELVLDKLQPPGSLKELTIEGCPGARSPKWMGPISLRNVEHIDLTVNAAWEHLPSLGKFPYLKCLRLTELRAVKKIDCEGGFQQLKYLHISDCEQWEEWSGLEAETVPWCPHLQELIIEYCPKLKTLPPLPLGLQNLLLDEVGLSDSPTFWVGSNYGGSSCSSTISLLSSPSLSDLTIRSCENLTSVAGLLQHHLTALRSLVIKYCGELVDLNAEEGFRHLLSIEDIAISDCPKLKMAPGTVAPTDCFPLSSLQFLDFSHCGELDSLFPILLMQGALTSLSFIYLRGANQITSFSSEEACRRLTSLRSLHLEGCGCLTSIEGLKALTHLHSLIIIKCPKLVQAAAAENSSSLTREEEFTLSVDRLDIDDPLLLHIEPLRKLSSVRAVTVEDCSHLQAAHAESWLLQNTSLGSLHLVNIVNFLPSILQTLSSLKSLTLTGTYELQSLPQLPSSITVTTSFVSAKSVDFGQQ